MDTELNNSDVVTMQDLLDDEKGKSRTKQIHFFEYLLLFLFFKNCSKKRLPC